MKRGLIFLALVGLLGSGCAATASGDGPPEINYGRDICIECGMIIDDPRFAASYRLADGTDRKFDDLGGLILFGRESGELDDARVWVSDFDQERMIEAGSAYYVPTLGVASPMGHGILAFADEARAMEMAGHIDGAVIPWTTVTELPVIEGLVGHHHQEHDGEGMTDPEGHDHSDE